MLWADPSFFGWGVEDGDSTPQKFAKQHGNNAEMGWKPGESGNPKGRPRKERALSNLLRIIGDTPNADGVLKKRALAEVVWGAALGGDLTAARLIYEYCDGKPVQRNEISGPDSGPIPLAFEHAAALVDLTGDATGSSEDTEASGADQGGEHGPALGQDHDGR